MSSTCLTGTAPSWPYPAFCWASAPEQATVKQWDDAIADLKEFHAWEKIPEDQPYGSLPALLKAEIGVDSEDDGRSLVAKAAAKTTGETQKRGGDRKSSHKSMATIDIDTQANRAMQNGISRYTQQKLDRLARDFPDICRLVAEGELTVAAAARAARIEKEPTPLQHIQRAWRKSTPEDKRQIITWMQDQIQDDPDVFPWA